MDLKFPLYDTHMHMTVHTTVCWWFRKDKDEEYMLQIQHSGTRLLAYMTNSTVQLDMLLAGTSPTYIEEADVDVEVNVHVIDSSIFSIEIQVTTGETH